MRRSLAPGSLGVRLVLPLLILLLWQAASTRGGASPLVLPRPGEVFHSLSALLLQGGILRDAGWTLFRAGNGFLLGTLAGVLLGAAAGSFRAVHRLIEFPVDFFRSLPTVTLVPLFMLLLGLGLRGIVAIIAFPCCWLVTINTLYGVQHSSPLRREMAAVFRLSRSRRFLFVTIPDALPAITASLRLSVAVCLHVAIIAEMLMGSQNGLGRRIYDSHMLLRVADMYALILVTGTIGYAINRLFVYGERRVVFWRGRG
jgi:ABC-type nitrate/sulfonate/bicarbonate transport system permease component